MTIRKISQLSINTIRTLSIDAIQQANSGHPGTPMGWRRCVLSGSAFCALTRRTHLAQSRPVRAVCRTCIDAALFDPPSYRCEGRGPDYEVVGKPAVSLDDIKSFRQFGSRCAGHPEYRWTSVWNVRRVLSARALP